jgi:hypothetical protein
LTAVTIESTISAVPPHVSQSADSAGELSRGAKPVKSHGTTELAPGVRIYNRVRYESSDYFGYELSAVSEFRSGRMVIVELSFRERGDGPSITAEELRKVPLSPIARHSVFLKTPDADDAATPSGVSATRRLLEDFKNQLAPANEEARIQMAATAYRLALAVGEPPTKFVAEAFAVSHRTAGLWIEKARRAGYLGESQGPGKASV